MIRCICRTSVIVKKLYRLAPNNSWCKKVFDVVKFKSYAPEQKSLEKFKVAHFNGPRCEAKIVNDGFPEIR